jgi:hypothetical protein
MNRSSSAWLQIALGASLSLPAFIPHLWSQTTAATILGGVAATDGVALPGVTVAVVNEGTNVRRVAISDRAGNYQLTLLPPGAYRVEAELEGFNRAVRSGIVLQVNQRALVDITLEIGSVTFEVSVVADAPMIDAVSAGIGTVIDNKKILELPLNGRDFFQLSTLVPGAAPPAEGSQNSSGGGAVSINGAREQANNFLLDGVDNNDLLVNQIVVPPSIDSIQEFKVQSSTYSAEFGRSAGGQFNYVTKSGTNSWHGSLYEFHRNAKLDAKNFFDDPRHDIPKFIRNQYGSTLGGPIKKDKLFVFGSYEGTAVRKAFTRVATVPPVAWRNGDFSSMLTGVNDPDTGLDTGQLVEPRASEPFPGNVIPESMIDRAGAGILDFYPLPDDPSATGPSGATGSPVGRDTVHQFTVRADQPLGSGDRLFYRYSVSDADRFAPFDELQSPTNVPGFGSLTQARGQSLAVGWTKAIGRGVINDFRFGFNRLRVRGLHENVGDDVASRLGIQGLRTDPIAVGRPGVRLGITDALIEPTNLPQGRKDTTIQLNESLSWIRGRHSLNAGAGVRRIRNDAFLDFTARGTFIFSGLSGNPVADLLLGLPSLAQRMNPASDTSHDLRTFSVDGYLQDDWRVSGDVTLNLGVRYDFNRPVYEAQDRFSIPDLDNPNGGFIAVGTQGVPRAGYRADANNLAPRLGVAWTPLGSSRSVVRAGYGLYHDTGITNANIVSHFNPPFFSLDIAPGPASLTDAFSGASFSTGFVAGIDSDYRDGYYHQFSAGVQHEPAAHLLVDIAYVGSRGRNLQLGIDPNQGSPGGPPVRNPAFGPGLLITSRGSSSYDSLQIRVERRFVSGLSFLSAYTLSQSIDTGSTWNSFASALPSLPQNSSNIDGEHGPSEFDSPHRWVLSYIWELPFGRGKARLNGGGRAAAVLGNWELAGITTFQSGRPFSAYYGPSANFSGTSNGANGGFGFDRPNQAGDPVLRNPDPSLWFDPQAFAPPDNTFGDVGRNTLRGAGLQHFDIALYKNIELGEQRRIQFRAEFFNAFNTPHFFLPVNDLTSANAGRVLGANDSRQIQFGLKFNF